MSKQHNELEKGNPSKTLENALAALREEAKRVKLHRGDSIAAERLESGTLSPSEVVRLLEAQDAFNNEAEEYQGLAQTQSDRDALFEAKWNRLDTCIEGKPWEEGASKAVRLAGIARGLQVFSLANEETADIPQRTWLIDGMLTPGFNVITAKKGIGKSFFVVQAANSIASGFPFLGRKTTQGRVLYVPTELDRIAVHERASKFSPCSPDVLVAYDWPNGPKAMEQAEAAILCLGIKVIIFDMFLAILPEELQQKTNDYGSSEFFRSWRRLGQRYDVAIVAVWHSGKGDREDFMSAALGTTGLTGQADCVLSLERKRGETGGKLYVGGNHGREEALSLEFNDCQWTLGNTTLSPGLSRSDEDILAFMATRTGECGPTEIAAALGRTYDAARITLSRLAGRGYIKRTGRGVYTLTPQTEQTEQNRTRSE